MVVADAKQSLTISGSGDVLEPHDGIIGESCAAGLCCVLHFLAQSDAAYD